MQRTYQVGNRVGRGLNLIWIALSYSNHEEADNDIIHGKSVRNFETPVAYSHHRSASNCPQLRPIYLIHQMVLLLRLDCGLRWA